MSVLRGVVAITAVLLLSACGGSDETTSVEAGGRSSETVVPDPSSPSGEVHSVSPTGEFDLGSAIGDRVVVVEQATTDLLGQPTLTRAYGDKETRSPEIFVTTKVTAIAPSDATSQQEVLAETRAAAGRWTETKVHGRAAVLWTIADKFYTVSGTDERHGDFEVDRTDANRWTYVTWFDDAVLVNLRGWEMSEAEILEAAEALRPTAA